MLYGRRLDQALQHVDGSRYALVHAVAKRARQITLWLTADPAELRAEAAPPPARARLTSATPSPSPRPRSSTARSGPLGPRGPR